jgi:hypothetical protein
MERVFPNLFSWKNFQPGKLRIWRSAAANSNIGYPRDPWSQFLFRKSSFFQL